MKVRKAVIPAAGYGTRFLPATKSQPKEMLTVVDIPVIQYVVEEAVASGITDILMIVSRGKRAVEDHFDRCLELEDELEEKNKLAELEIVRRISNLANIHFIRQKEMRGLGDAISLARHHIGNEPFAVLLGDTLLRSGNDTPVTKQLLDVFDRYHETVVALEEVSMDRVSRYGVIDGSPVTDNVMLIRDLVEKPKPEVAPSNLVIASRYILTPEVFSYLDNVKPGKNGEIQITDALRAQAAQRAMYGVKFCGKRFDAGNKIDFLKTNITYALEREDLREPLAKFIIETAEQLKKDF
ncbi:MAG: UTP--glucose-1-phosphate uridylyltransferase GalU [Kiritimatiellae bacterium]|nr:UTP--glucose-1-phosphate uridylyltransferase GalU [Kiritimatiellia bacterium]MBQ2281487.1 UTP--glucose-1-phosphate uridylyltransferase GalU [Kiritimatiellia bacterium]